MKSKTGRPTEFREEYCEQARKFCLLGATDAQLGEFFGVSEITIQTWKKKHTAFGAALREGKEIADAKVAESLYRRAIGFKAQDTTTTTTDSGEVTKTQITDKEVAPDPQAAMYWLNNRQRKNWSTVQKIDHTTDGEPINTIRIISE